MCSVSLRTWWTMLTASISISICITSMGDEGFATGTNGSWLKLRKSVGLGFEPGRWSLFLCHHSSEQCFHNHYRALATPAYTELPTSRKYCTITSCSTLRSQLHNTSILCISSFVTWAPTLVFLQYEAARCDITTANLGRHPQRPASSHLPSSLSPPQLH